jgi:hypothetical protein
MTHPRHSGGFTIISISARDVGFIKKHELEMRASEESPAVKSPKPSLALFDAALPDRYAEAY